MISFIYFADWNCVYVPPCLPATRAPSSSSSSLRLWILFTYLPWIKKQERLTSFSFTIMASKFWILQYFKHITITVSTCIALTWLSRYDWNSGLNVNTWHSLRHLSFCMLHPVFPSEVHTIQTCLTFKPCPAGNMLILLRWQSCLGESWPSMINKRLILFTCGQQTHLPLQCQVMTRK